MPNHMAVANPSKALIAMVGMVCITVLMALEKIATEAATGMLGAIIGYAIGNGIAAATRQPVHPIIGRKDDT
jgi:hypothetical protein